MTLPSPRRWSGWLGLALILVGSYVGLAIAPPDRHMGDVVRLLYIHVPTAWNSLLFFTIAGGFAVGSLWTGQEKWDDLTVGTVETGVVLTGLLLVQGMIWGRPTWGIWWSWGDVRMVSSFLMLLLFAGVLSLRSFIDDPVRRTSWTAVATIIAWVDVPIVYYCVRWFRSLHQAKSTVDTMDPMMVLPMRTNAFAILFLGIWFLTMRAAIEARRKQSEDIPAPAPVGAAEGV
ncbi:MAG: cytochrome c biogenesis protein CcsA [Acidobacteriota bacterium]|nr:cytochrome c biogenesis protein CcsA [Acidobacteriota bacterium]